MLGYDDERDLLGKNMHNLIHHSYPDGSAYPDKESKTYQAFRKGQGTHVDDEVLWRKDGSCFPAEYWSYPIKKEGKIIGAVMTFLDELLLHVSRPVRWDSDHVVILRDELQAIAQEVVRGDYLDRVHLGLDFFDASINRIGAWVIGTRCMIKALLMALLEPIDRLRAFEQAGDYTARLALTEELKTLPFGAVWDSYCVQQSVPVGMAWLDAVKGYERDVLSKRDRELVSR